MRTRIELSVDVDKTPRVIQMAGLFDVPLEEKSRTEWDHILPFEEREWNIGMIVGPSGAGKSSLANNLWPGQVVTSFDWPADQSILDAFPADLGIKDVTGMLTSVGLGSPPAWVRPYRTLSTGEGFRATIARALAETEDLVVVDEFTSVVDRQVAQVASHSVQKAVRRSGRKFVAVSCHYDIEDWLQPDWVYDVAASTFTWRVVQPHPPIDIEIYKANRSVWPVFARHHYLSTRLASNVKCWVCFVGDRPVAFESVIYFPHPHTGNIWMGHRLVVLPDWQGLGIATRLLDFVGQHLYDQGLRFRSTIAHPAMLAYHSHSPRWREVGTRKSTVHTKTKEKGLLKKQLSLRTLGTRSFEFVPPRKDGSDG